MKKADFTAFLRTRSSSVVDWGRRRQEWLAALQELLETVQGWLAEYSDDGVIREAMWCDLEEEGLGRYRAPGLLIRFYGLEARLEPVGAQIIGARGRADLKGFHGAVRFVLVPEDADRPSTRQLEAAASDCVWKMATPPPDVRYRALTEEVFLEALLQVVNGGPS